MSTRDATMMHVSKDFKNKIKVEAAMNNMSIIEFSKILSKKPKLLEDFNKEVHESNIDIQNNKRKLGGFKFGI